MNIEFPVDQVAACRNGYFCDPTVVIDLDLADLSDAERRYLDDHIEGGVYAGSAIEAPDSEAAVASIHDGASRTLEHDTGKKVAQKRAAGDLLGLAPETIEMEVYATRQANGRHEYRPFSCCRLDRKDVLEGSAKYTMLAAGGGIPERWGADEDLPPVVRVYYVWIDQENRRREARAEREARSSLARKEIDRLRAGVQCG